MIKSLTRSPSVGTTFNTAMELYKENFVLIFLACLITGLISAFSCGICAGPMQCGLFCIILALLRKQEPKPQVAEVFNGFKKFLPSFVCMLVFGVISGVAQVLNIVPLLGQLALLVFNCFIMPAVIVWALLLIQDQDAAIGDAIVIPLKLIGEKKFWSVMLVVFVAGLLGAVGAIACGIGLLFTVPFSCCMIAAAYEEAYGESAPVGEIPARQP